MRSFAMLLTVGVALGAGPDAREIIRFSCQVNNRDWDALPKYSHRETDISSKVDANGKPKAKSSKTYEVLMVDGSPYQKLIALNGSPLSPQDQQKEEAKVKKEIARRQREPPAERASRIGRYRRERQDEHLLMNEMINAFTYKLNGEDQVDGHPVYVLDATPRPDYHPPNRKAKVLTGMKGRLWVEKQNYHWVKVEAEVTKPVNFDYFIAKVGPGTRFQFEQAPVDGNFWLPKRFIQTVNARILGIKSYRTREEETYSDYRPANVQVSSR